MHVLEDVVLDDDLKETDESFSLVIDPLSLHKQIKRNNNYRATVHVIDDEKCK